jgi:LysM repeat protein
MMQTDVKSAHIMAGTSGLVFAGRTRLKGAVVSNTQSGTPANILFANNVSLTATYSISTTTVTVTVAAGHGLATGARVFLDYTSGNGTDNIYTITVTGVTTFTAAVPSSSGTGNVLVYAQTLMEIDITNSVPVNVIVPGEGIVANDGIFVGVPANIAATVFYG